MSEENPYRGLQKEIVNLLYRIENLEHDRRHLRAVVQEDTHREAEALIERDRARLEAAALAEALHFMCAAVRTRTDPLVIEELGILDAALAALRAAGWDPDEARPCPYERKPAGWLFDAPDAKYDT